VAGIAELPYEVSDQRAFVPRVGVMANLQHPAVERCLDGRVLKIALTYRRCGRREDVGWVAMGDVGKQDLSGA